MIQSVEKIYNTDDEGNSYSNTYKVIMTDSEVYFVPHDTANRHYQEILEWVAEGNTITDNGGSE